MERILVGAMFLFVGAQTAYADHENPLPVVADEAPAVTDIVKPEPEPVFGVWDKLAACESTSRWHIASGNGYFGGLQQDMTFWRRHGGMRFAPRPDLATRGEQILVAQRGLAVQGWSAWPACSRRLGLR